MYINGKYYQKRIYIKKCCKKGGNMARFLKPVLGVLLIIMAVGLLLFWEVEGRDAVMKEKILVAEQDIFPGTKVNARMFKEVGILSENMISNGITLKEISGIDGKISNQMIPMNGQISKTFFSDSKEGIDKGYGIYQIRPDWIFSVSSSLRKGDSIDVYVLDGKIRLGGFQVAFVKDEQGKEVIDEEIGKGYKEILDRENGSEVVSEFEIISTLEQYSSIREYIFAEEGKLIIVNSKSQ